jgi:hypothetical protein
VFDLGFTLTDFPSNNLVYETWTAYGAGAGRTEPIVLGTSPYTATFEGGSILVEYSDGGSYTRTAPNCYGVFNGEEATITFETPAYKIDMFAAQSTAPKEGINPDGFIEVYDMQGNLVHTVDNLEGNLDPLWKPGSVNLNADDLGIPDGISKIVLVDHPTRNTEGRTAIDDFGFTPIGVPGGGTATPAPPAVPAPEITTQPLSQSVTTGHPVTLSVEATGDDLTYQWYGGIHPDANWPVAGATESTMTTGGLGASTNFWVQVTNDGGTADSDTAAVTVTVPLVLTGSGSIAGEDIQHPSGNIFDQVLLTGESIKLQAKPGHITRVSFMDEDEDIVQVEYSGAGTFTVTLDSSTYLAAKAPPRYNQSGVAYVTGKPSVVIEGADETTYFSIFTVGKINAVNQALFPEGQEYGAQADVTLLEVTNSTGMGGMQLSNAVFSGSTGNLGIDARGVPIAVRLTVGDIDASGDAVPHLLFGSGINVTYS